MTALKVLFVAFMIAAAAFLATMLTRPPVSEAGAGATGLAPSRMTIPADMPDGAYDAQ